MGQSTLLSAKTHPLIRSTYRLQGLRSSGVGEIERRAETLRAGKGTMEQVWNGDMQEGENILEMWS